MDLDQALTAADDRLLLSLLVHHSGDERWITGEYKNLTLPPRHPDSPNEETATTLRNRLHEAVCVQANQLKLDHKMALPDDETVLQLIRLVTGADLPDSYLDKLKTDFGFESMTPVTSNEEAPDIIVVGGGFSGFAMAVELRKRNIPFRLLERHQGVGGVWYENSYPGCGVDSPSHVYGLAANAMSPSWSQYFARRQEILAYFDRTLNEYSLADSIEYDREVVSMRWHGTGWEITTQSSAGSVQTTGCDVVISAVGTLNQPKIPDIPGIETFTGDVFHTARWRHDVELAGKRVGMIGNGSSGFQAGPYLAETAGEFVSFQRSPAWASQNPRVATQVDAATRWLLTELPGYSLWYRFALYWTSGDAGYPNLTIDPEWTGSGISAANDKVRERLTSYVHEQLSGRPDLIEKLLPDYPPYTKRLVVDNGFYRSLKRDNVRLVTTPVKEATRTGLVTTDNQHFDLDVLVYATGFYGTRFLYPVKVEGVNGVKPAEETGHDDDIRAYLGVAMPGFPNLFSVFGPNSSIGHGGSAVHIAECQAHYIAECVTIMTNQAASRMEISEVACADYNVELDRAMKRMVWTEPGIASRYRNTRGRIVTNHPWTLQRFWELTRSPRLAHFRLSGS